MNKLQNIKSLCLAAALVLSGLCAQAQELEFSAYFNGVLPTSSFGQKVSVTQKIAFIDVFTPMNRETIATNAAAGLGFTGRAGYWFDMGFGEIMPYVEVSFLWNSLRSDVRKEYDAAGAKYPAYFNVPAFLGFKYRYDINDIFRPFVEVGVGYDFLFITRSAQYVYYNTDGSEKETLWYRFTPSGALCWEAGIGTYLGRNVSVGLYYLGLGNHKIRYARNSRGRSDDNNANVASTRTLGDLALRLGFHF